MQKQSHQFSQQNHVMIRVFCQTMVSRCGCPSNELYGWGKQYGFSSFKYQPVQVTLEVYIANIKLFL